MTIYDSISPSELLQALKTIPKVVEVRPASPVLNQVWILHVLSPVERIVLEVNTATGIFSIDPLSGGGGGSLIVQPETLSAGQISAKQITLSIPPINPSAVLLEIQGGTPVFFNVDYTVTGTTLSWAGLGLDGFIEEGELIRAVYQS